MFVIETVCRVWETGNPTSKGALYNLIISEFGREHEADCNEFEMKMGIHTGSITPAFSQWPKRVLSRHRFSVCKESISQAVPTNWLNVCVNATGVIRTTMSSQSVTCIVNADEMFLNYYPKELHLVSPQGIKRVGSTRGENEKKGCTVMVACEMFQSAMLSPYLVMTAQRNGTLARRYSNWEGTARVTFQPQHWMDKVGCLLYLEFLKECYPDEKVGLIWDAATSHICYEVIARAES